MSSVAKAIFLLSAAAAAAFCTDFAALKPEGYVSDFAHVLDPSARKELDDYCAQLERSTGAQLALVTIPSLDGEPVEDVANLLFRKWGIGQKGKNEGALLLLAVNDRRSRLEVGYGLEPILPDGSSGSVLRAMRPSLRAGNYSQALADAAREIGGKIAAAKGVQVPGTAPLRRSKPAPEGFPWEVLLIVGGVLLVMLLMSGGRGRPGGFGGGGGGGNFLLGMLAGQLLSGGSRGSSGGGFGGYDSGDSFGGFGGGDSGGGGASSSW
jgi:uncharacterized protein